VSQGRGPGVCNLQDYYLNIQSKFNSFPSGCLSVIFHVKAIWIKAISFVSLSLNIVDDLLVRVESRSLASLPGLVSRKCWNTSGIIFTRYCVLTNGWSVRHLEFGIKQWTTSVLGFARHGEQKKKSVLDNPIESKFWRYIHPIQFNPNSNQFEFNFFAWSNQIIILSIAGPLGIGVNGLGPDES
jgi:hypothetical protein